MVRVSSSVTSLLIAKKTSTTAGTKQRSQVTSSGQSTGHHAMVNKPVTLKVSPNLNHNLKWRFSLRGNCLF